jgi:arylformamidase
VKGAVFLHYTQEELDRAYDQRAWAANAEQVIASYGELSRAVKARYKFTTERYGPSEDEVLDLYPPVMAAGEKSGAPVHVFIHGGAWRLLTKEESAFPAPAFVENGVVYVALNFATIPKVRLPDMVEQCRRAIVWLHRNAWRFGGDPNRLHLSGHSSGGHLAAVVLTTDWKKYGLPEAALRSGLCASGMYDLAPVLLSARSSYVKLDKAEEDALSPMRHLDRVNCPIAVAYGDGETPEFKRHARDFAAALKARHHATLVEGKGLNHFEMGLTLGKPDGLLGKIALDQIFRSGTQGG